MEKFIYSYKPGKGNNEFIDEIVDEVKKNGKSAKFNNGLDNVINSFAQVSKNDYYDNFGNKTIVCEDVAYLAEKIYNVTGDKSIYQPLEKAMLKYGNIYGCYYFAKDVPEADISAHERAIIDKIAERDLGDSSNSGSYRQHVADFANLPGVNVDALSKAICQSNDCRLNSLFAQCVRGVDIKAHQRAFLRGFSKSDDWDDFREIIEFANKVPGADKDELGKFVALKNEDEEFVLNLEFAIEVKGLKLETLKTIEKNVLDILNTFDADDIKGYITDWENERLLCDFANLKGIDKDAIENWVLEKRNTCLSYYFANYLTGADIKAHEDVVVEGCDLDNSSWTWQDLVHFAAEVPGANKKRLSNKVLGSKCPYVSFSFVEEVSGLDEQTIKAHEKVVLNGDDVLSMFDFAANIPQADREAFLRAILDFKWKDENDRKRDEELLYYWCERRAKLVDLVKEVDEPILYKKLVSNVLDAGYKFTKDEFSSLMTGLISGKGKKQDKDTPCM